MIKADIYYKENLKRLIEEGSYDENPRPRYKDGSPAHTKFITQVFEEYDISKGEFPITTLRNTAIKTGIKEILWIYNLQSNSLEKAREIGINWWDEWDIGDGTIGNRYGYTVAQHKLIDNLLNSLKQNPFSRRHIMNMYQEGDLNSSKGLYPCAYETIWSVRKGKIGGLILDMTLIQRSNDYIMSGFINKIQYVALQMMIANTLGYQVGKFCHMVQNLHIYDRHIEAAHEILSRDSLYIQPSIELNPTAGTNSDFYSYTLDDFTVRDVKKIPKLNSKLEIAI